MTSTPPGQPTSTTPTHPAHILLARAHSPPTASELFTSKIKQKPLLLRATAPPSSSSDSRALRRHIRLRKKAYFLRKRKPPPLSAKEKRILGVHTLKKEECKYAIYKGLHRMWVGYMQEVLSLSPNPSSAKHNIVTANTHGSLLASADYHGAEVQVVRSGCVDRVGLKGIVVRDTKFTFVIVTPKDEVKSEFQSSPLQQSGLGGYSCLHFCPFACALISVCPTSDSQDGHDFSIPNTPSQHRLIVRRHHGRGGCRFFAAAHHQPRLRAPRQPV
jgi:hypothetical protein